MIPKRAPSSPASSPLASRRHDNVLKEHEEIMMNRIDTMALGERQELADRLLAWEALISPSREPPSKQPVGSRGIKKRQNTSVRRSSMLERFNSSRKQVDSPKSFHSSLQQIDLNYAAKSAPVSKKKNVREVTGFSKANSRTKTNEVDHTSNSSRSGRSLVLLAPDLSVDDDNDSSSRRSQHRPRESASSPVSNSSNRGRRHRRWSINGYGIRNTSPRPPPSSAAPTRGAAAKTTALAHHSLSTMDYVSASSDHDRDRNLPHIASGSVTTSAHVKIASAKARQKLKSNRRKHVDQSLHRIAQNSYVDDDSDRHSITLSSSVHDESPGGGGKKGWYNSFHESLKGSITGPTRKKKSLREVFSPSRRRQSIARNKGDRAKGQLDSTGENRVEGLPLAIPYLDGEDGNNEIRKESPRTRSSNVRGGTTTPTRLRKRDSKRGGRSSTPSDLPPMLPL